MEIKQLKTFITIAKTGNFSHASDLLGYAQPTVTTHIKLLEDEFHVRLFERLGHKVKLTHDGKRLLYYAENILKLSEEAVSAFSERDGETGKISIGANESFSVVRLPLILKDFVQRYPKADVSLKFGSVKTIHEALQNNEVDIAFLLTRKVNFPDLILETLIEEPVSAVAAPGHPFALKASASITDFENQDLIITQENCTYRALIEDLINRNNVHPKSVMGTNNIHAIKQLVMSGLGVAILPRVSVEYEIAQNLMTEIPWKEAPLPVYTQIAYHKDKWLSPTLLKFLEQARSIKA
jgi:DNA-binding transcriptional LysR family regulator